MRNHRMLIWTLAGLSVGCAGVGGPGGAYMAQGPQQQYAAQSGVLPQQNPSVTQKIFSVFRPEQNLGAQTRVAPVTSQSDPVSLGFKSPPPNAQLFLSMAKMSDHSGRTEHAREMYHKALTIEPQNLEALLGLARLEDREGRLDEALKVYQQAATAHPKNAGALNDLALCLARTGQLQPSLGLLEQAIRLQPDKALYRNNIAKVLVGMNRSSDALANLFVVHPPAAAQYNLGVLLQQLGRSAEAKQHLIAATNIDPQMESARNLLAQLNESSGANAAPSNSLAQTVQTDDSILPTPRTPAYTVGNQGRQSYPNTGAYANLPLPQTSPGVSTRIPVGNSPMLLPPVR